MAGWGSGADDERLAYSLRETARKLGVSLSTIEKAVRDGALGSVKLRHRRLIPVEAVDELLAQAHLRTAQSATSSG